MSLNLYICILHSWFDYDVLVWVLWFLFPRYHLVKRPFALGISYRSLSLHREAWFQPRGRGRRLMLMFSRSELRYRVRVKKVKTVSHDPSPTRHPPRSPPQPPLRLGLRPSIRCSSSNELDRSRYMTVVLLCFLI